ncbi:DUF6529 family protein [Nocardioides sp. GXQ0305]|uniref:DUF6529 family protein n=1 Tax=Nocardioides sp. GXQ0305 TaxID=3423912 RepID=UPI003D7CD97D
MSVTASRATARAGLGAALLTGAGIAVVLGVYAGLHDPAGRPLSTFGFSGMLQMKAWFTTAAAALLVVQVLTALRMWGRLGAGAVAVWVGPVHRWSGAVAFVLTLPPAVHCLWALGFAGDSPRALVHSVVGCLFYGAYAAKMLGLRLPGLPRWALPVLGGLVLTLLTLVWLTSSLWFFTRSGLPLT